MLNEFEIPRDTNQEISSAGRKPTAQDTTRNAATSEPEHARGEHDTQDIEPKTSATI